VTGLIILSVIFPWFISATSSIILYPFHVTSVWIKTSDGILPSYLRSKDELIKEVDALRTQISTTNGTQMTIMRLVEENMQLRSIGNAGNSENKIIAQVLARPDKLAYDLLQIDKGAIDGVVEGAPVYTGVDSVVGMVVSVKDTYSFVDLFTSPGFESTAFIFGPNVFSPIEGMGGGVARVRLPQGVAIAVGQLVILPGVSSSVYGEIVKVESQPTQPEQYGYITPPLSMANLMYVSVGAGAVQVRTDAEINETISNQLRAMMRLSTTTRFMYEPEIIEEVNLITEEEIIVEDN
jgi:cell shape-determining protein MreC